MLKKLIRSIDNLVLNGRYYQWRSRKKLDKNLMRLASGLDYQISSFYKKNNPNLIAALCDQYGSDKGTLTSEGHPYPWPAHTYTDHYYQLFAHTRNSFLKVFECGLGTNNPSLASSMGVKGKPGASLRMLRHKTLQQCARLTFGISVPKIKISKPDQALLKMGIHVQNGNVPNVKQILKKKLISESTYAR